jgi:hypothetical protein
MIKHGYQRVHDNNYAVIFDQFNKYEWAELKRVNIRTPDILLDNGEWSNDIPTGRAPLRFFKRAFKDKTVHPDFWVDTVPMGVTPIYFARYINNGKPGAWQQMRDFSSRLPAPGNITARKP